MAAPSWSALLGGHHVDIARDEGHLLAPAFGALQFQRLMLGDGLGAFKLRPAFVATILVSRHGLKLQQRSARSAEKAQFTAGG